MLGEEFARTLRAAQAGSEDAFVRLWRDANPAMVRYLRVVGHDDPYDGACEGWITVLRGLPGFCGDETAWWVWLLACTRLRAEEGQLRRQWAAVTVLPGVQTGGDGDLDIDELLERDGADDPTHRAVNDTLTALRNLPLGQGEVLMLRLGASLPAEAVADVMGVDTATVSRSQARALERLGVSDELLAWSLAAPATPAELADVQVVTGAFRAIPSRAGRLDRRRASQWQSTSSWQSPAGQPEAVRIAEPRVILLSGSGGSGGSRASGGSGGSRPSGGSRGATLRRRARRGVGSAGRSPAALLGVAAISASAVSLTGLGAAAYVGVLPEAVQQVMHDAIGAPAPAVTDGADARRDGATKDGVGDSRRRPGASSAGAVGPNAANSPAAGLCRAWATDRARGTSSESSVAFRNLATAAGGAARVETYCATAVSAAPTRTPAVTPSTPATAKPHPAKPATGPTTPPAKPTGPTTPPAVAPTTTVPTTSSPAPTTSTEPTQSPEPGPTRVPGGSSPTRTHKSGTKSGPTSRSADTTTRTTTDSSSEPIEPQPAGPGSAPGKSR